jgi:hypothetical protein
METVKLYPEEQCLCPLNRLKSLAKEQDSLEMWHASPPTSRFSLVSKQYLIAPQNIVKVAHPSAILAVQNLALARRPNTTFLWYEKAWSSP